MSANRLLNVVVLRTEHDIVLPTRAIEIGTNPIYSVQLCITVGYFLSDWTESQTDQIYGGAMLQSQSISSKYSIIHTRQERPRDYCFKVSNHESLSEVHVVFQISRVHTESRTAPQIERS